MFNKRPDYYNYCITLLFVAIFHAAAYGQYDYKNIDAYKLYLEKNAIQNTQKLDKQIQKQYADIINEKNTELIRRLKAKDFLFDTVTYAYLNSIFDHVLLSNSLDKDQFHFFVDRTFDVNAYSFEDGTIVCNLGLLAGMQNESQLAMVFCHEIGHYLLMHSNNAITNRLTKYNSREFLAQIKKIRKQEYNTKKQLESLLMEDVFNRSRHSRKQEYSADSLGMVLFSHTRYSAETVPNIFDYLNSATGLTNVVTIQGFLNSEHLEIEDFAANTQAKRMHFGTAEKKEITDSLKTHPDCDKRKTVMQDFFRQKPKLGNDFIVGNNAKLDGVKKSALFEEAKYSKDNENLGLYLYQLIQIDALFPNAKEIKTELYSTLTVLHQRQRAHTFNEVVNSAYIPQNDNDQYAVLLKMLDNLSLKQLDDITKTYYANNKSFIIITKN